MTFIISAATSNFAFQIADTRLTSPEGSLVNDLAAKMVLVHCYDAKLSMAYTGIAAIRGIRTDVWIQKSLDRAHAWKFVFVEVLDFLVSELNAAALIDQNIGKYGLTIDIIGLGVSPAGLRQAAIAKITNQSEPEPGRNRFKDVAPIGRPFARYLMSATVRHFMQISGAIGPEIRINGMRRNFQKQFVKLNGTEEVRPMLDHLVAMLRLHRDDKMINKFISPNCVAVAIRSDFGVAAGSYGPQGMKPLFPAVVKAP